MNILGKLAATVGAIVLGQVSAWQLIWMGVEWPASAVLPCGWCDRLGAGRWLELSVLCTLLAGLLIWMLWHQVRRRMERAWRV